MTTVNYKKFKLWLHENNIDVDINFKPTRYLCNYAYYLALSNNTNCVFVHIPSLSKFPDLEKISHYNWLEYLNVIYFVSFYVFSLRYFNLFISLLVFSHIKKLKLVTTEIVNKLFYCFWLK